MRYKAAGHTCALEVTADDPEMQELLADVETMRGKDLEISWYDSVELKRLFEEAE